MMATTDSMPADGSLAAFLATTAERADGARFANESARTLRIEVDGGVWLKPGAAVAYRGDLVFERRPTLGATSIADAALRETAPLVRAVGRGRLFVGHHGEHAHVVRLEDEAIVVATADLLAFEESLAFESSLVGGGIGLAAGGLVATRLSGRGAFALAAHGRPLTLPVVPGRPLSTDPHATMAWSPTLAPSLKTDLTWRSIVGHGGHEPVQMRFEGAGFVVVQPFEDPRRFAVRVNPVKRLAALVTG